MYYKFAIEMSSNCNLIVLDGNAINIKGMSVVAITIRLGELHGFRNRT